jgi:hypothetical protein
MPRFSFVSHSMIYIKMASICLLLQVYDTSTGPYSLLPISRGLTFTCTYKCRTYNLGIHQIR